MEHQDISEFSSHAFARLDGAAQLAFAEMAIDLALRAGASYADIRVGRTERERHSAHEARVEACVWALSLGFGVRVLHRGSWGFAASETLSEREVRRAVARAMENAEAGAALQAAPIILEDLPACRESWSMPLKTDPFAIPAAEKSAFLLAVNEAAMKAGADYCRSTLQFEREERLFASSRGSRIVQNRVRTLPFFTASAIDRESGRFASRASMAPPRGAGWEHVEACDLVAEAAVAAEQAREKLRAKPVEPGRCDVVIDGTNLWLTLHESVGHATELDRALGWEANYAGTTFVTPAMLDSLQYGSPLMTVEASRTVAGGLATVAFDDDGVRSAGSEFLIVENGVFRNFQMAIGQAHFIGRERSNGCAYAEKPTSFPLQRMPNISLRPNAAPCSLDDLIGGVDRGVYFVGDASWSIDQQRDNFQFSAQLCYEIKGGRLGPMLRDAAYQDRTLRFWNSLDGLGDRSTHRLCGSFWCGKAQPSQVAPVSHGTPAARFRNVSVITTAREDV